MKKVLAVILAMLIAVAFIGCAEGGATRNVIRRIDDSGEFSYWEINSAMNVVEANFKKHFRGCTLKLLEYDDGVSSEQSEQWRIQYNAQEAIVLISEFDVDGSGKSPSLNPNQTYKNWQWILTKNMLGMWEIKTSGY